MLRDVLQMQKDEKLLIARYRLIHSLKNFNRHLSRFYGLLAFAMLVVFYLINAGVQIGAHLIIDSFLVTLIWAQIKNLQYARSEIKYNTRRYLEHKEYRFNNFGEFIVKSNLEDGEIKLGMQKARLLKLYERSCNLLYSNEQWKHLWSVKDRTNKLILVKS